MKKSENSTHRLCKQMRRELKNGETGLVFVSKFREYGLSVRDGGSSYVVIKFCPWCGNELPRSLRQEWLKAVARLGLEPGDERIPAKLLDDSWYKIAKSPKMKSL